MSAQHSVVVTAVRPPNEPGPHTVLVGVGHMLGTGQPVTFAGDQRQMWDVQHALDDGETVIALIEDWQIVGSGN